MKNIFYTSFLFFAMLNMYASKANGQYYITSETWLPRTDSGYYCTTPTLYVITNAYVSGLSIIAYFGDGTSSTSPVYNGGSYGYANCYSYYSFPGTYSVKYVLLNGTTPVDSVINPQEYLYCSSAIIKCVHDSLGTGIYDSALDHFITMPIKVQVDYNGIPKDTISITSGTYYAIEGALGDVYTFRILSLSPGVDLTFPTGGIIYDTIQAISNNYVPQFFGFKCTGATSFDLAVNAVVSCTGIHDQSGYIYVSNRSCDPVDATVTMNFSPKYAFPGYTGEATPPPSSVSGNTITWNLPGISMLSSPIGLYYAIIDVAGDLVAGDTVEENVTIMPIAGDSDPANNTEIVIDTVLAGVDPNEMSVLPSGYISAGTTLQYTINFENTGTDTAYNISVYDTLSNNVNVNSLNIVMASAVMNIAVLDKGGLNIVKFDFPNINLLDSANHGLCNGAVIFTVNTLSGLPAGTTIFNHAGIFFDYNPVVMTNTVEDIIAYPSSVSVINNPSTITLYPNPANNELTISSTNQPINSIAIANLLGQTMYSNQYNSPQVQVDVADLPTGVYFVKVNGSEVRKFVKE